MATYYINADTGNDSTGTGASGSPWLTLSKAVTSSASGDTIVPQNATATYSWVTQNFANALTIAGQSVSGVVFDAANTLAEGIVTVSLAISNITYQNLTIANNGGPRAFETNANLATISITNCIFKTCSVGNGSGWFGGLIGDRGQSGNSGIYTVTGCLFNNVKSNGTGNGGILTLANSSSSITFNQNTVYNSNAIASSASIFSGNAGGGTVTYKNNIFYSTTAVIWNTNVSPTTTNGNNNCVVGFTSPPSLSSGITSDPLFIDTANSNFNLRPTSPAIDAGAII